MYMSYIDIEATKTMVAYAEFPFRGRQSHSVDIKVA